MNFAGSGTRGLLMMDVSFWLLDRNKRINTHACIPMKIFLFLHRSFPGAWCRRLPSGVIFKEYCQVRYIYVGKSTSGHGTVKRVPLCGVDAAGLTTEMTGPGERR